MLARMQLVTAIILGALAGALGGFGAGLALLQVNRLRNRRAEERGEPPAKNLLMTSFHVPAAMVGALAGAITSTRNSTWLTVVCGASAFPVILFVLFLGALVVERVRKKKDDA
jgi:hypothetical protein